MNDEFAMQKLLSTTSYVTSGVTAAGGALTVNDWALLLGIALAVLTFAVNWIYKDKQNRREKELHQLETAYQKKRLEQLNNESH